MLNLTFLFLIMCPFIDAGVYTTVCQWKWGNGCIPVYIDPSISTRESEILEAIDILNSKTNTGIFHTREEPTQGNYIKVVAGNGCSSFIGKVTSGQELRLAPGCPLYSIVHEFMHAIGIYHEQSRPDRDNFVTINFQNVQSGFENNFEIANQAEITPDPFDNYDYGSVMHYSEFAFSVNGRPTIDARGNEIGNRNSISDLDIQTINNALLECGNETPEPTQCEICLPSCRNGGVCKEGRCDCEGTNFGGNSCQDTDRCSPSCRNNGICVGGNCDCSSTGYTGETCQIPVCNRDCGPGNCVGPDTCDCSGTGFTGSTCRIPVCEQECKNGGRCIAPNVCDCSGTSYTGNECEVFVCLTECQNGGKCIDNSVCDCTGTGYTGNVCEIAQCTEPCVNGICEKPNECNCKETGHTGKVCDVPVCEKDCVNGICAGPNTCVCNEFWSGNDCEEPVCEPECGIDQECRPGNICEQVSVLSFNFTVVLILLSILIVGVYILIIRTYKKK